MTGCGHVSTVLDQSDHSDQPCQMSLQIIVMDGTEGTDETSYRVGRGSHHRNISNADIHFRVVE